MNLITQLEAMASAEYWIHFTARFGGVHAFDCNFAESEPIWMTSGALWVHYCRGLVLADFGRDPRSMRDPRAVATAAEPSDMFLSSKQRRISPTSRRPNSTKFEHMSIDVAIKTVGSEFCKFYHKGSFFQNANISQTFYVLRLQAVITPQWLQIAGNSQPE